MQLRKSLALLFGVLFAFAAVQAEELEMGVVKYQYFRKATNQTEQGSLRVLYDDVADRLMLFVNQSSGEGKLKLAMGDVAKLRANLEKYIEWEKLAIAKEVELKKPLPDSAIACPIDWTAKGNKFSAASITLSFDFLSRSKLAHWLQIGSNEAKSEGSDFTLETMYLDKPAAIKFLDVISEKNVAAKRKSREEQKAVEGLFQ
jgi:hypothetical protein